MPNGALGSQPDRQGRFKASGAAWQTAKDMTYNAPVQAIGQKNINAFGNTLADMFYRKPLKALKGGLSRQVFGGIR